MKQLEILPSGVRMDEQVRIRALGLPPKSCARITATMRDDAGRLWESEASFRASSAGVIDVAAQAPFAGTYRGADAMGLFWSMRLDPGRVKNPSTYVKRTPSPVISKFRLECEGKVVATAECVRRFIAADVEMREVLEEGLVGRLFIPKAARQARSLPAVMVLGGSGGGLDWNRAAALAAHGYVTFALAYFGIPSLPPSLNEIPLEYFEHALRWLRLHCAAADPERIAVMGSSKGGELALLLAATFPEIRAVIALVPSGVVWRGIGKAQAGGRVHSSWTWRGEALPFVPWQLGRFYAEGFFRMLLQRPIAFTTLYERALRDSDAVARAAIAVEKIQGPVLLISAGDDQVWPSRRMAEMVIERLSAHKFPHAAEHLCCEGAGHTLRPPYTPATVTRTRYPFVGIEVVLGGAPEANHHGQLAAWRKSLEFLDRHLR